MTHIYYEKRSLHCSVLQYPISLFFVLSLPVSLYIHLPLSVCLPSSLQLLADRQRPAFIYARGLSDEPRGVTMFVVKCYKSGRLRGTRGEPTWSQPWRPSADKALLIQMDRTSSGGDLSMCQLPTSQPQITSAGQAPGIYRKSRGLEGQHREDPQ